MRAYLRCSAFVGRPRDLFGADAAGRHDLIHSSTSCSYQHKRRLPGILNGRGIRCLYFSFVANVRIVVTLLPRSCESCSVKRMRTGVALSARRTCTTGRPEMASGRIGIDMTHSLATEPHGGSLSDQVCGMSARTLWC